MPKKYYSVHAEITNRPSQSKSKQRTTWGHGQTDTATDQCTPAMHVTILLLGRRLRDPVLFTIRLTQKTKNKSAGLRLVGSTTLTNAIVNHDTQIMISKCCRTFVMFHSHSLCGATFENKKMSRIACYIFTLDDEQQVRSQTTGGRRSWLGFRLASMDTATDLFKDSPKHVQKQSHDSSPTLYLYN